AVDESVVTVEERNVAIVEEGGAEAGATIETAAGRPVRVAVDADRQAFEDLFYEAIIGTSDTGIPGWEPDATLVWDGTTCEYAGPDPLPDRLIVEIDNMGSEVISLLTGTYAPDTTTADLEAYQASGGVETPAWWAQQVFIAIPTGARDVWVIGGTPDVTAICFVDPARLWEIAGPRLAG
ncbi:MAG: hypothetical protein OEU32_17840, partial [Acidimicrobiia bacterium]|nr:hypothetical protein [Acidimicrobiia bacterium]